MAWKKTIRDIARERLANMDANRAVELPRDRKQTTDEGDQSYFNPEMGLGEKLRGLAGIMEQQPIKERFDPSPFMYHQLAEPLPLRGLIDTNEWLKEKMATPPPHRGGLLSERSKNASSPSVPSYGEVIENMPYSNQKEEQMSRPTSRSNYRSYDEEMEEKK